jgi:phosphoglycolate phosphatase-like HAD superfamily hydrolase
MMRKHIDIVEEGWLDWFGKAEPEVPPVTPLTSEEETQIEDAVQGDEVWEMVRQRIEQMATSNGLMSPKEAVFSVHQIFAGLHEMSYSLGISELALHQFLTNYLKKVREAHSG